MKPATPRTSLKVIQLQFVFQFPITVFDPPATLSRSHKSLQARRGWHVLEKVLRRMLGILWPFHQQPTRVEGLFTSRELIRRSDSPSGKTPFHLSFRPLAPCHFAEVGDMSGGPTV
jgi:hypothetical protein